MFDNPDKNSIANIVELSKKIQANIESDKIIIPIKILHTYIRSCPDFINRCFFDSSFGTARYMVRIVINTPINVDAVETNEDALSLQIEKQ